MATALNALPAIGSGPRHPACFRPPHLMFPPVRTRLFKDLTLPMAVRPKLLSFVAPVGYGKTVLMSQLCAHLRGTGERCYWVGLDERHARLEQFLHALQAAPVLEAERDARQALWEGDEPTEHRIEGLLALLDALPCPATIFIDNLNSCSDERLGAFLDTLLFRTQPSVRFVWSSTTALSISTGRAKLAGLMRAVGFADLCLDTDETADLLGTELKHRLGDIGVAAVHRRTEGWPAAIRMAQIVLSQADQPLKALDRFSGADEDVAALLQRQVLDGFTPALRDFLLCLAPLRSFTADLCRHVTASDTTEAHVEFLLKRNVFLIPLDRQRVRFRLHGLFREYLLGEAARHLHASQRQGVLERAATWCEQHEDWHDAIDYALMADAFALVGRLLDRVAPVFVREQGNITQYVTWVEQLQARGARIGWATHFWYVWALVFQRRYEFGRQQHRALAQRCADAVSEDLPPAGLLQRIAHLRICIDLFTDHVAEAYHGAEDWAAQGSDDPYSVASIGCIKSLCLANAFKLVEAREALRAAQPVLLQIGGADMAGWSSLILGLLLVYEGDYGAARQELCTGLAKARARLGDDSVLCGTMALVAAKCAVEMQLDDEAQQLLTFGFKTAQHNVLVDTAACGLEAAVKLWQGGSDERISISKLRELARGYPPRLSLMLSCYLVRRLVQLRRFEEALLEAERIPLPPRGDETREDETPPIARYRELRRATEIELSIALRRPVDTLLTEETRGARQDGRAARLVELELDRAALALRYEQPNTAAKALMSAICRAAPRRIIRPFCDRAETVARLIELRKATAWSFSVPEEREFLEDLRSSVLPSAPTATTVKAPGDLVRMLPTAREAELLSLMEMGLSNQEIAERTQVSITTIKWHLRNLYKKFGVSNRTAALARARHLITPRA